MLCFTFSDAAPNIEGCGPDSNYLAKSVGIALKVALAEVAMKRPSDPIEFLAACLYKYSSNIQRAQEVNFNLDS